MTPTDLQAERVRTLGILTRANLVGTRREQLVAEAEWLAVCRQIVESHAPEFAPSPYVECSIPEGVSLSDWRKRRAA